MLLMIIFPLIFIVHFIPSFIARKRSDFLLILLINILAGWSVIGWLIALYLALRKAPLMIPVTSVADELAKLSDLRNQGALTQQEFEHQKNQLLHQRNV